jgi:hypothetical protein
MNLANELDLELDNAVKRHLGRVFDKYFTSMSPPETKTEQLQSDLKLLEGDIEIATKALEQML